MTLKEEFENEIKINNGGISVLFETSNQKYIEWLESKVKNLSSNTVLVVPLLKKYSEFLEDNGYLDSDWW